MINFSPASIVWSIAVGDQKVCILQIGSFKALKQTFWNTKQRRQCNEEKSMVSVSLGERSVHNKIARG